MSDHRTNIAPELLTALHEARDAMFASAALRDKNEHDSLASKRDHARLMPGADRQSVADLGALFDLAAARTPRVWFSLRWVTEDEAKKSRAAIRALPAERRASLFRHLLAVKAHLGWDGELEIYANGFPVHAPEGDVWLFEKFCEGVMMALCDTGYPVDAELATRTLDWLAHHCPQGYDLKNMAGRNYWKKSLGAVKGIAQAVAKGMALPDVARRDALIVFDRYHDISADARDTLLAKGGTLEPAAKALLDISGYGRQDTFFQRMQAIAPTRVAAARCGDFSDANWALYRDFHREVRALVDDVKRAFADGFASPSWLSDPEAFRATFDVSDDEMAWQWWTLEGSTSSPTPEILARPGFAALRESKGLQRVAEASFRSYADAELEDFQRFARGEINPSPFTFDGEGVPDIAAFTFEGADGEGRFLDHLVSLDATKPSAKWLKATDEHLARIGVDKALGGFVRWLGHLHDHSLDAVDWNYTSEATMAFSTLWRLCDGFARSSCHRSPQLALRRLALDSLWSAGVFVGPHHSSTADYARSDAENRLRRPMSEPCVAVARGVVWAMSRIDDARVPTLLEAAGREFYFKKFGDFRSKVAGNAVLWSLGQIGTLEAAYALARLRRAIRDKSVAKLVDTALEAAGARVGIGLDDMQDLATSDYGIGPDGTRTEMLGTFAVTLAVVSSRKATLMSLDTSAPKARRKRGIPKAALTDENANALADELAEAEADIALLLPEARARLQSAWRRDRCWRLADWRERLLENGLVATLSRRLIWRFNTGSVALDGIPRGDGTILLADGETLPLPGPEASVRLWHPLAERVGAVTAWRERLKASEIRQPFAQAWRASYVVTDAERETRTYSNRFAGHILHQPPLIAILRKRGWIAASRVAYDERSDAKPNRLLLPAFGVAAEFWFSGVGAPSTPEDYGAPNYEYVTTDRLMFHALDAKSVAAEPLPLDQVPAMAFSETLCDLESAIDATSVAADRFWSDRGADARRPLSEVPGAARYRDAFASANRGEAQAVRKAFLESLLPSLSIAESCHFAGDWLIVDGKRMTYRIHLGSGASQLAASGRHLCIVPTAGEDDLGFLSFEGDATTALILSKAMLLAQDDRIEDPTILSQLAP
ncbi:DUF4132 domain-containing protein [Bradyrhizobium valentinum]|uniref:Uncharacterized protein n=1 Tax=Bradyrhizobium valentinum TaxID=1518501 RepID=A0A0R3LUG7_9BRAD|nr:DUF4132 domain-containing protein [Bradyrhizobium valentinum]KRQ94537.1 hypothetical protein CQ10_06570 [Bradyrhizobium valentinum]KRR08438.1 hypothetical protein CP49_31325 [Bradyrhizobium valentinum]